MNYHRVGPHLIREHVKIKEKIRKIEILCHPQPRIKILMILGSCQCYDLILFILFSFIYIYFFGLSRFFLYESTPPPTFKNDPTYLPVLKSIDLFKHSNFILTIFLCVITHTYYCKFTLSLRNCNDF